MEQRSNGSRAKSFLAYGFTISVALHLIVLPFVRPGASIARETPPEHWDFTIRSTPPPPPRATPTPRATPRAVPRARIAPHPIRIVTYHADARRNGPGERVSAPATGAPDAVPGNATTGAPEVESAAPAASATTAPRPTPTPLACARPDVPAATVRAAEPEMPALAQQQGIHGTVDVVVALDAQSRIVDTAVQNSPSRLLDAAALAAARGSQFRTEVHECIPVAARYLFRVDFTPE